jgi:phospholipid/cholesterol/gamma-HCH transport system substrate-binding protein
MDRTARQSRRPLYGALLIAGIVAGALLIFFLEDLLGAFKRTYAIVALVPDAPGLAEGSPVWLSGKPIGEVRRVGFMPTGADPQHRVWVRLRVPTRMQQHIREDSRVRVTSASLLGEQAVDIAPGSPGAPVLAAGDTLRARRALTAEQVTERAALVRAQLDSVLGELRALAPTAEARLAAARHAFTALDGAMAEAARLRADLQANPGAALLGDTAFTGALQRTRQHVDAMPAAAGRLGEQFRATGEARTALAQLQARADTLGAILDAAAAMLDSPDGFIGRSRHDPALRTAVEAARASLDSLVSEARRNPMRFVF